jgi:peptide/nickel transport system permease protein
MGGAACVLLGTSFLIFGLLRLAPGDPVDIMFGPSQGADSRERVSQETRDRLRKELGLEQPILIQYIYWMKRVSRLDLGFSFRSRQPVVKEIFSYLPATIFLALFAFLIEVVLAVTFGIVSAIKAGSVTDHAVRFGAVLFRAVPSFWLGLLLLYLFAVKLKWVSVGGELSFRQALLPALTLGVVIAPRAMRVLRAGMLAEMNRLYMVFGRAKGVKEQRLLLRHALRNALLPTVTLLGMSPSGLLGGSAIIETVFSWPGIGKFLVDSIYARDYPVVQAYVLFTTIIVVSMNLLVDLSYTLLDPRVRLGTQGR